ncbi:MAG: translation initiation factor IF-2 subunit gamma [Candidatus Woesearchaeota archaeon]|nr:translation initiation factor IF-2 subunit gamma [Candidatus Woesearchaeota archaeon]
MPRKKPEESEKIEEKEEIAIKKNSKEEKVQPEINIGMVGHVDHGKTTLTMAMTGKWTDTHSEEIKKGITIRLGYADASFYKCNKCEGTDAYTTQPVCKKCGGKAEFLRNVSFVDAPGHESLMATMLSGATIMDGALLLVAANEECPQPQTREHLMALEIIGIDKVVVVQNKVDAVSREGALQNYNQIKKFLENTKFKDAPIIPISAQHKVNIGALIEAIQKIITTPARDSTKDPIMFVARSFDINKPGDLPEKLIGGVLGGSLKQGMLKVNDEIEIRPGYEVTEANKKIWKPLKTKIAGLMTGSEKVDAVKPGGSIGVLTLLDPAIIKADSLGGAIVGLPGKLPNVWYNLNLETHLLERVVGSKDELNVEPIKLGESLMLNVNSAATVGIVTKIGKNKAECRLKLPVCAEKGSRVTISRLIKTRFRLIGYGIIKE